MNKQIVLLCEFGISGSVLEIFHGKRFGGIMCRKVKTFQICFQYAPTHAAVLPRRNYATRVSVKTKDVSISGCQHVTHCVVLL